MRSRFLVSGNPRCGTWWARIQTALACEQEELRLVKRGRRSRPTDRICARGAGVEVRDVSRLAKRHGCSLHQAHTGERKRINMRGNRPAGREETGNAEAANRDMKYKLSTNPRGRLIHASDKVVVGVTEEAVRTDGASGGHVATRGEENDIRALWRHLTGAEGTDKTITETHNPVGTAGQRQRAASTESALEARVRGTRVKQCLKRIMEEQTAIRSVLTAPPDGRRSRGSTSGNLRSRSGDRTARSCGGRRGSCGGEGKKRG